MCIRDRGKALGQSVIVENRAGASGNIGMAAVARAEPNGYTLAINTMSLAINPALFRSMPFDTVRDLRSVGTVGTSQHVLTVSPSLPVNNVKELLDYIRARPANELSFGSAGTGSTFHMAAELFKSVLVLYGSMSASFLNKAADDAKNRRSGLGNVFA